MKQYFVERMSVNGPTPDFIEADSMEIDNNVVTFYTEGTATAVLASGCWMHVKEFQPSENQKPRD